MKRAATFRNGRHRVIDPEDVTTNNSMQAEEPWRLFRIMGEFVDGFEELSEVGPAVAFFGSSRISSRDPYYQLAARAAKTLVNAGYAIITGAGPGIMEGANRGATEANGQSVGLNIQLPIQQAANRYVRKLLNFKYFFCRRVMFVKYSKAFVVMPGGYGTLDEFFEIVTLIQTEKIEPVPVILVGKEFWQGVLHWMERELVQRGYIDRKDLDLFQVKETPAEILDAIETYYHNKP